MSSSQGHFTKKMKNFINIKKRNKCQEKINRRIKMKYMPKDNKMNVKVEMKE